jgi:hypothetical protein
MPADCPLGASPQPPWCEACDTQHEPGTQCEDRSEPPPLTDERRDEIARESAELAQRAAAERERSFFFQGPTPEEEREREMLAAGRYPRQGVNHVGPTRFAPLREVVPPKRTPRPAARRAPRRTGRTYRPGARRTSRVTRAGPQSEDEPPHRAAAATLIRVAAANIVVYASTRQDAIVLSRVVRTACRTYEGPRRG